MVRDTQYMYCMAQSHRLRRGRLPLSPDYPCSGLEHSASGWRTGRTFARDLLANHHLPIRSRTCVSPDRRRLGDRSSTARSAWRPTLRRTGHASAAGPARPALAAPRLARASPHMGARILPLPASRRLRRSAAARRVARGAGGRAACSPPTRRRAGGGGIGTQKRDNFNWIITAQRGLSSWSHICRSVVCLSSSGQPSRGLRPAATSGTGIFLCTHTKKLG